MEQELKQMLRDKMDSLSGEPGSFDKGAAWQTLETRLNAGEPPQKRFVIYLALRCAAAAALLAFGCLFWLRQREDAPALVRQQREAQPSLQEPLPRPLTPPAPAGTATVQVPAKRLAVRQRHQVLVKAVLPARQTSTGMPDKAALPGSPPQPAASNTAAIPPRRRAVHLLDVSTEDRSALLPREPVQSGSRLSIRIDINRSPAGSGDGAPASIFRGLLPPAEF